MDCPCSLRFPVSEYATRRAPWQKLRYWQCLREVGTAGPAPGTGFPFTMANTCIENTIPRLFPLRKWKQTLRTQDSRSCCRAGGSSAALAMAVGTRALLPSRTAGLCFSLLNRHHCNLEQSLAFTSYFMYLCMYEFSAIQQLTPGRCCGKRRAGLGRSVAAPPAWPQPLSPPTLLLGSLGARCKPS